MARWLLALVSLLGCDDSPQRDGNNNVAVECTPENEGVQGATLEVTPVYVESLFEPDCNNRLLVSAADVMDAFPNGDPPAAIAEVDFTIERVVVALSNPVLRFAVDDGVQLVVGEEPLCQGAAPRCVAYIIHGTTRDLLEVAACPYRFSGECSAP